MPATKSRPSIKTKFFSYENFMGLDTSRDVTALDTGKQQHLAALNNAYCDWRGQIVRDASAVRLDGQRPVTHVSFYTPDLAVWVERTGAGLDIVSQGGARIENAYPHNTPVVSTVYNGATHYFAAGQPSYIFSGEQFTQNLSPSLNLNLRPAFAVSVDRRLAIAGITDQATRVELSRVDNVEAFADDEDDNEESVLRAGFIDIKNQLNTPDRITGLGAFEGRRLVIFTNDRALVYRVGENINEWQIDDTANIFVGTNSHKTIQNAGTDLLFCSRSGVHSIRRSAENGLLVYSYTLSAKIEELYRQLYKKVSNPQDIEAVWDQDRGQYHIFFPCTATGRTTRLTLSLGPESAEPVPKFSTGDAFRATCGAALGGKLIFGTEGGLYKILEEGEAEHGEDPVFTPEAVIEFPWLWHGSTEITKQAHSLIIQASGSAELQIDGINDDGKTFGSIIVEVNDDKDDNSFQGVPLFRQYERKWEHRYRAAKYRITVRGGSGTFRLVGFAVRTREP